MNRRSLALCALFILESSRVWAAPATPCDEATISKELTGLHAQLTQAEAPKTLEAIAAEADKKLSKSTSPAARGCLAYIAGSAHFVLSSKSSVRVRHATQALHYFLQAQALSPPSMATRQPASRLKTAWKRLGRPKGWTLKGKPQAMTVPGLPENEWLVLRPPNDGIIAQLCGDHERCQQHTSWTLRGQKDADTTVHLRPGLYGVSRQSPCGLTSLPQPIELRGTSIPLPPPVPCSVRFTVLDGDKDIPNVQFRAADGRRLKREEITTTIGQIRLEAPGYQSQITQTARQIGGQTVRLQRCTVPITVETTPQDSKIENAEPGPWGKRSLTVSRFGHETEVVNIDIPKPQVCDQVRPQVVQIALKRAVTVQASDESGQSVTPNRLVVDGHPVDVLGFHLRPGQYTFAAIHPGFGHKTGAFVVTPCMAGTCKPEVLSFRFDASKTSKNTSSFWNGPRTSYVVGAAFLLSGLGFGLAASSVHSDINQYETKAVEGFPIQDLVEQRSTYANVADVLLLSGGVTITAGWLWSLAGDNP